MAKAITAKRVLTTSGLIIGGVWLFNFIKKGSIAQKLQFGFANIGIHREGTSLLNFRLWVKVTVTNLADSPVLLNGFNYNLFYKGAQLGNIYSATPVTVPAHGTITIQADVISKTVSLLETIWNIITKNGYKLDIDYTGTATIENIKVPVSDKFTYDFSGIFKNFNDLINLFKKKA